MTSSRVCVSSRSCTGLIVNSERTPLSCVSEWRFVEGCLRPIRRASCQLRHTTRPGPSGPRTSASHRRPWHPRPRAPESRELAPSRTPSTPCNASATFAAAVAVWIRRLQGLKRLHLQPSTISRWAGSGEDRAIDSDVEQRRLARSSSGPRRTSRGLRVRGSLHASVWERDRACHAEQKTS